MKFAFLSHLDTNLYLFRLPIMQDLVAHGHKVFAVCPKGDVSDQFAGHGISVIHYDINRSNLQPLREIKVILRLAAILRRLQPDVLHTFTAKPNIYGTLAGRFAGVPVIYNLVEGLGSFYVDQSVKSRFVRECMEAMYRISCRLSNATVFVNKDDPQYFLSRQLVPRNKIHIIRSVGVDTDYFRPGRFDAVALRQSLGLSEGVRIVLMVARAIWHKGVAEYIAGANQLRARDPNVFFLLAGAIDEGNPSSATSAYLLSQPNLIWLGHRRDIAELTALCDVYVLPSWYREGVPRTLLEAASMAKPIVTTDTVGCREVVENGVNGFLVPIQDSHALAERISTLLQDDALRHRMGLNGRAKAIREFDVQHVVRQYLELYGVS